MGPAVVWDVAVENIGKYERRRTSTYQLRMLAGSTTGIDRQSTYYDRLNLLRWVSSCHLVPSDQKKEILPAPSQLEESVEGNIVTL